MSLTSFFKDYVYIPLGGSRKGIVRYIRNLFIVWFLTGLWHGASWNYVGWGLYSFAFMMLEKYYIKDRIPKSFRRLYTIVALIPSFIIFRFTDPAELFTVLGGLVGVGHIKLIQMDVSTILLKNIFFIPVAILASTPLYKTLRSVLFQIGKQNKAVFYLYNILETITPAFLLVLSVLALIGNSYNPFLYFQF